MNRKKGIILFYICAVFTIANAQTNEMWQRVEGDVVAIGTKRLSNACIL